MDKFMRFKERISSHYMMERNGNPHLLKQQMEYKKTHGGLENANKTPFRNQVTKKDKKQIAFGLNEFEKAFTKELAQFRKEVHENQMLKDVEVTFRQHHP